MKINIKHILSGFINIFKDKLGIISKEKKVLYKKRLNICLNCQFINEQKNFCTLCGCYVHAKTKVDFKLDKRNKSIKGCPKKYW
jgi:uncharacterized paraquat-inducible protein A